MDTIRFVACGDFYQFRGVIEDVRTGEATWVSYMTYVTEAEAIAVAREHAAMLRGEVMV